MLLGNRTKDFALSLTSHDVGVEPKAIVIGDVNREWKPDITVAAPALLPTTAWGSYAAYRFFLFSYLLYVGSNNCFHLLKSRQSS